MKNSPRASGLGSRGPVGEVPASRRRVLDVLELLEARQISATIAELTERLGGHPNTVRLHLTALTDDGLITRVALETQGRGRPAHAYLLTDRGRLVREASQVPTPAATGELFAAVAEHLASVPSPREHAQAIGRIWAEQLADRAADLTGVDPVVQVVDLLTASGFSPHQEADPTVLSLRTCPMLESARSHPDVVCTMHEGMLREALNRAGAPDQAIRLEPFAKPGSCLVHLPA